MYDDYQRNGFLKLIKESVPTHTSHDDLSLMEDISHNDYEFYSTSFLPFNMVVDMAMNFVYKYASYTPGSLLEKNEMFLIKQPLFIYSHEPGSLDRTMVWANGYVHYVHLSQEIVSLFVDKKLIEVIKDG